VGGECSTSGEIRNAYNFFRRKTLREHNSEHLGVDGKII
jgi:hypothetical protein